MEILDVQPEIIRRSCIQDEVTTDSNTMWPSDRPAFVDVPPPGRSITTTNGRLVLMMVLSGESHCLCDRKRYVLHRGQILVVPPSLRYVMSFDSSTNVVIVYVSESFLVQALCRASHTIEGVAHSDESFDFPPHVRLDRSNIASALYASASSRGDLIEDELLVKVTNLAAGFVLHARGAARRISATRPDARHELFRRVCIARANIESDPLSASSLATLASSAALSPFHLLRTFSQAFGETPAQMRRRLLNERAKALLCGSNLPIGEVAAATGFESHAAFCRAFRRMTGYAPTTYRSRAPDFSKAASTDNPMVSVG